MKSIYKIAAIVFLSLSIVSCKKVIDLQLDGAEPQLIIEGVISDQGGSKSILLTRSVNFDAVNTFPNVSGAVVKVTDSNNNTYNFTEKTPGNYSIASLTGRSGRGYTLSVQLDGKTYTATSVMPQRVVLDSATISEQSFGDDLKKTVSVYYKDPGEINNQYRFIMFVNGTQVRNIFVRDDQFSNGRQVQALLYQNDVTIKSGDRIDVDMQCIDEAVYKYWYTFAQQYNIVGGSTSPSNPPNNFNTNVLGYFSAHTTFRRSFVVR
jgi:hypothetical protein